MHMQFDPRSNLDAVPGVGSWCLCLGSSSGWLKERRRLVLQLINMSIKRVINNLPAFAGNSPMRRGYGGDLGYQKFKLPIADVFNKRSDFHEREILRLKIFYGENLEQVSIPVERKDTVSSQWFVNKLVCCVKPDRPFAGNLGYPVFCLGWSDLWNLFAKNCSKLSHGK